MTTFCRLSTYGELPAAVQSEYGEEYRDKIFLTFWNGSKLTLAHYSPQAIKIADEIRDMQQDVADTGNLMRECAAVAHSLSETYMKDHRNGRTQADKDEALKIVRKYDALAAKFLGGLEIHEVVVSGRTIALKIGGSRGYYYSVHPSGDICNCDASIGGVANCWHSLAAKVYMEVRRKHDAN